MSTANVLEEQKREAEDGQQVPRRLTTTACSSRCPGSLQHAPAGPNRASSGSGARGAFNQPTSGAGLLGQTIAAAGPIWVAEQQPPAARVRQLELRHVAGWAGGCASGV